MLLLSLACLIIGTAGYFTLPRGVWAFYVSAHLGALGVMGLFGVAAGALAVKKGRDFWPAFYLGSALPILAGIMAVVVFLLGEEGRLYCGGSVCLLAAALVVLVYALVKAKVPPQVDHAR